MKKSKLLLTSGVIGSLYFFELLSFYADVMYTPTSSFERFFLGIFNLLIVPHTFFVGLALIFNWVAFANNEKWATLVAGILYCVSALLMPPTLPFFIIEIVLCFVAYAKIGTVQTNTKQNQITEKEQ